MGATRMSHSKITELLQLSLRRWFHEHEHLLHRREELSLNPQNTHGKEAVACICAPCSNKEIEADTREFSKGSGSWVYKMENSKRLFLKQVHGDNGYPRLSYQLHMGVLHTCLNSHTYKKCMYVCIHVYAHTHTGWGERKKFKLTNFDLLLDILLINRGYGELWCLTRKSSRPREGNRWWQIC